MKDFELCKPFGIPVIITSWWQNFMLLIFAVVFLISANAKTDLLQGLIIATGVVGIFCVAYFVVILHEFGHALTAKYFNHPVEKIMIIPFSGLACIGGDWATKPKDEFWITVMGPMVNVALIGLCYPFIGYFDEGTFFGSLFDFFFEINVVLLAFNALPIYPMDGGRIVRSLATAISGNWHTGTSFAHGLSMIVAVSLAVVGFWYGYFVAPFLILFMAFAAGTMEVRVLRTEMMAKEAEEKLLDGITKDAKEAAAILYPCDSQHYERTKYVSRTILLAKITNAAISELVSIACYDDEQIEGAEIANKCCFDSLYDDIQKVLEKFAADLAKEEKSAVDIATKFEKAKTTKDKSDFVKEHFFSQFDWYQYGKNNF